MTKKLQSWIAIAVTIICLDSLWIGFILNNYYLTTASALLRGGKDNFEPHFLPALFVYIAFIIGIETLVISGASNRAMAGKKGAILGLCIYAVYDMTNLSLFHSWTWALSLIDILWGTFLISVGSFVGALVLGIKK